MFDDLEWDFESLAVRAGTRRSSEGEHSEALYLTSSFVFKNAAEAAARFGGSQPGNIYSRFTNPTVAMFEKRLAALEGGERCVATSSGMAAILSTCLALLQQGDHIVCSRSVFGTTVVLFEKYLKKMGVSVSFVSLTDLDEWRAAITDKTKLFFLETPSNPLADIADIRQLSELAHSKNILLVVDNCFCTPALQKPLALGADLVIHSATKYIDGQGRCLGGAVVGRAKELDEVYGVVRTCGTTLSAFNAWIFLKGLETLSLRMEAHSQRALALAEWLQSQNGIEKVFYTGLDTHPQHALAASQQRAFGGVVSFIVAGGQEAAWRFIDATQLLSITANLGDAKSTITHPATTTHGRLSPEAKAESGITSGLIRISVGLESFEDIRKDCERGLAAATTR
jgi:O-succinylhomoserine sulfhydrylase